MSIAGDGADAASRAAEVTLDDAGQATVLLRGDWDIAGVDTLRAVLADAADGRPAPQVTIDLVDTSFLDLPSVAEIVALHRRVTDRGGAVHVVCSGEGVVHRMLTAARLGEVLDAHVKDGPALT